MMPTRSITHIIYDLDGLLLDTLPFYTRVIDGILKRYGKTYSWDIQSQVMGRRPADGSRFLVGLLGLPITPEQFLREREAGLAALFPGTMPKRGAEALTWKLGVVGVPQAVASSSIRWEFDLKTQRHADWFAMFSPVVLGDDPGVKAGKPAPDIFLAAAQRLGVEPSRCLVFEDALNGVQAAKAAGMAVIAVPDPRSDRAAFAAADQVLDSLERFDSSAWGLPAKGNSDSDPEPRASK